MWTAKIAVLHYLRESHTIDQLVKIKKGRNGPEEKYRDYSLVRSVCLYDVNPQQVDVV